MPGPNKNYGQLNADAVGSETNPTPAKVKDISIGPANNLRDWGDEIHVVHKGGQSNAVGNGDLSDPNTITADPETGVYYDIAADELVSPIEDPMTSKQAASAWPAFAVRYRQLTGVPVCIVISAQDGSSQTAAADSGSGNWSSSGSLRSQAVTDAQNAVSALESAGYNPRYLGMMWSQGEADAVGINQGDITVNDYEQEFGDMVDYFADEIGDEFRLYLAQTGRPDGQDPDHYAQIRDAQLRQVRAKERVSLGSDRQVTFEDRGLMRTGEVHYNVDGLNEMGRTMADSVVKGISEPNGDYVGEFALNSVQNIPDTSDPEVNPVRIPYDTEVRDDFAGSGSGLVDISGPNYNVFQDGEYTVDAFVTWTNSIPDQTYTRLTLTRLRNGVEVDIEKADFQSAMSNSQRVELHAEGVRARSGDRLRLFIEQESDGTDQALVGAGEDFARMRIERQDWREPIY